MLSDTKVSWVTVNKDAIVVYQMRLKIDNDGRTPATNTAVLTSLIFLPKGGSFAPQKEISETCHKEDKAGPLAGVLVPPDTKNSDLETTQWGSLKTALSEAETEPRTGDRTVSGNLSVCLLYRSPISQRVHHTGLLYIVSLTFSADQVQAFLSGRMRPIDMIELRPEQVVLHKMDIMNGISD